jgi:hypothetical protein
LLPVSELVAAKPVDLVTGELQGTVMGDHLCLAPRVGALLVVGIVVDTVELDHNTPAVGQQEQEVHPLGVSGMLARLV